MTALEIVSLGGLGEFGRNVLWFRYGSSSVLVDAGVSFPDETFSGIDRIAPDFSPLSGIPIDAILLTHGHEDHVGALPLLREWCDARVFGLPFTLALARRRLEEAELSTEGLIDMRVRERVTVGAFRFSFYRVAHSVPDSAAILLEAGGMRLFHSGDFKFDPDPPDGELTDREGIAEAAAGGVDLALVDSTNAERTGRALSERVAGRGLEEAFSGATGRIILTTFSSHIARISQAAEAALARGRKVAFLGRSVRSVAEIAEKAGRLRLPGGALPLESLGGFPADKLLCVVSGSQAESSSALYRLALDEHTDMKLSRGDLVLFSARTIPGHERSVNRVTDHLVRRGARVLRDCEPPIHVSGHAHREDISEWLTALRPRAVLPVHGEWRMLAAAAEIAVESGVPPERVLLLENGDRLSLEGGELRVERQVVPTGRIYLDSRPELVDPGIVRERRQMAEDGFVLVLVPSQPKTRGEIAVVSRGVSIGEAELAGVVSRAARAVLERSTPEERSDAEWLRAEIALLAKRACRRAFGIRPVVVPVIL